MTLALLFAAPAFGQQQDNVVVLTDPPTTLRLAAAQTSSGLTVTQEPQPVTVAVGQPIVLTLATSCTGKISTEEFYSATIPPSGSSFHYGPTIPCGATTVTWQGANHAVYLAQTTDNGKFLVLDLYGALGQTKDVFTTPVLLTVTTVVSPPGAPTNLAAAAVSFSQINLSWTAPAGAGITYDVFRSTASGFAPSAATEIASAVAVTSYSDTGLLPTNSYFYLVTAMNSAGQGPPSNQASATTSAQPPTLEIKLNWQTGTPVVGILQVTMAPGTNGAALTAFTANLDATGHALYYFTLNATASYGAVLYDGNATTTAPLGNQIAASPPTLVVPAALGNEMISLLSTQQLDVVLSNATTPPTVISYGLAALGS